MLSTQTGPVYTANNCHVGPGVRQNRTDGTMMVVGRKGETSYCVVSQIPKDYSYQSYDITGMTRVYLSINTHLRAIQVLRYAFFWKVDIGPTSSGTRYLLVTVITLNRATL